MLEKMVTIELPESAYRRLQRAAELTHRSLGDVLISALSLDETIPPNLPTPIADELVAMAMLNDAALQGMVESSLTPAQARRLRQLTHAAGERSLTPEETSALDELTELYDRSVLRRARAFALLAYRGYGLPTHNNLPPATVNNKDENSPEAG